MTTYSTSLKLTLIGDGEQTGTWGSTTNTNFGTLLEQAIVGQTSITMANADYTLTNLNGTTDEARSAVIIVTGTQNATYSVIVPAVPKLYMVTNSLTAPQVAYIKMSGGTTTQVPNGQTMYLYCTGVIGASWGVLNYVQNAQNIVSGGTINTGAITCTSLTSSGAVLGTTLTSTVTTGTAPFTVASTTPVTSLSIGGNAATATTAVTVSTTVASGATGTTQTAGDNSTKMATTAYVATAVTNGLGTLGTMATQNANNVAITGGTINGVSGTNASLTVGNATNATNATTAATVSTTVASGAVGTTQTTGDNSTKIATTQFVQTALQLLYPIGAIYSSTSATNPGTAFGFGTWVAFGAGRVMIGNGGGYTAGATGGSADATLVSHSHGGNTGAASNGHVHAYSGTTATTSITGGIYGISESFNSGGGSAGGVFTKQTGFNVGFTPIANDNADGGAAILDATHSHTYSGTTGNISEGHNHPITADGSSATNANLQPYIVVYMWNRTA